MRRFVRVGVGLAALAACGRDVELGDNQITAEGSESSASTGDPDTGSGDGDGDADTGPALDVAPGDGDGDGDGDQCKVGPDDMDAPPPCEEEAPPDSFDPAIQWTWSGVPENQSVATPLVANLSDDNDDGAIDLCDVPDVVVVAYESQAWNASAGHIYVLDGATGELGAQTSESVVPTTTPAVGDIDGDGRSEIVSIEPLNPYGRIVAFEHDGTLAWTSTVGKVQGDGVALADLDADGDVEIIAGGNVLDHEGTLLWGVPVYTITLGTAADLDGDGMLEVIFGRAAYRHDGTSYYDHAELGYAGSPHVADIDADGEPEVVVSTDEGISVVEHDGTLSVSDALPEPNGWTALAVHDLDGDGEPELVGSRRDEYAMIETDLTEAWAVQISDATGHASGTAFDFLGDGSAEAMYADETLLHVYGDGGAELLTAPRDSWTRVENPVVADVDNDRSAEIVVVSNAGYDNVVEEPTVAVLRDAEDRWIPARRIWNQHTYHVTNVREDGTIPQHEPPHWKALNTFRTQAQVAPGGGTCQPEPEG